MKKTIALLGSCLMLACAFALAGAEEPNYPADWTGIQGQKTAELGKTEKDSPPSGTMDQKAHRAQMRTCIDEAGTTHKMGTMAYNECMKVRKRAEEQKAGKVPSADDILDPLESPKSSQQGAKEPENLQPEYPY